MTKHKHQWQLNTETSRYHCTVDGCTARPMTEKQMSVLPAGRAKLSAKHATTRAQRAGVDVLTGNEPATPDTGPLGPKVVDTPYPTNASSASTNATTASDQSATNSDKSTAPVDQSPPTGTAPVADQSTGRRRSKLERTLRQALGLDD